MDFTSSSDVVIARGLFRTGFSGMVFPPKLTTDLTTEFPLLKYPHRVM